MEPADLGVLTDVEQLSPFAPNPGWQPVTWNATCKRRVYPTLQLWARERGAVVSRPVQGGPLVEADSHLLEVLRHIHRNPLRAGMVTSLTDYRWCSHHGYLSRTAKWSWLHKDGLLGMLAVHPAGQKRAYVDFVSRGEPEEIERFSSFLFRFLELYLFI